jgi:hypothetical protein
MLTSFHMAHKMMVSMIEIDIDKCYIVPAS